MIRSQLLAPSAVLREFVRQYIRVDAPAGPLVRPIIARTEVVLAFNLRGRRHEAFEFETSASRFLPETLLVGPQTSRRANLLLTDGWASFGIHFQPAAFFRLFHIPVVEFTDQAIDAADLLGPHIAALHGRLRACTSTTAMVRLAEDFIGQRARHALSATPAGRAANAMFDSHGRMRVLEATRAAGLSERHFERCFLEQMGMAPKLFARVTRLNFVLRLKHTRPALTWAQASQVAGYFDQTHLVKDFKAMAGAPPAAFLRNLSPADGGFLLSS